MTTSDVTVLGPGGHPLASTINCSVNYLSLTIIFVSICEL